jgi:hypothetical protein
MASQTVPATAPAKPAPAEIPAPRTTEVVVAVGEKGQLKFQVALEGDRDAYFALGVRKSGSTLLNKIVQFLARRNGLNTVDVPGTFFRNGFVVADWLKADLSAVVQPNNVYSGFRSFPTNFGDYEHFRRGRKVFMFRDPRDALVSQYFSDAYSHSLPSRETETGAKAADAFEKKRADALSSDIDSYVIKHARSIENTLMAFSHMLKDDTCLVLRYEDYVFQKKRLIHKILQHFDWSCAPGQVEALLKTVDEVPDTEEKQRFVRKVIPGDHRNKLSAETIRRLNNQLRDSLGAYDYY